MVSILYDYFVPRFSRRLKNRGYTCAWPSSVIRLVGVPKVHTSMLCLELPVNYLCYAYSSACKLSMNIYTEPINFDVYVNTVSINFCCFVHA